MTLAHHTETHEITDGVNSNSTANSTANSAANPALNSVADSTVDPAINPTPNPTANSAVNSDVPAPPESASDQAYHQALAYGRDLARVYTAEKQKRQHLELAYQMLNAVFSSTPEGTVVLSDDLSIQQANAAFVRMLDLAQDAESLAGSSLSRVLPAKPLIAALAALENNPDAPHEVDLTTPIGTHQTPALLNIKIARLRSGTFTGWLLIMQDHSRQRRIEQQKSEFITVAADELQQPLKLLIGRVRALHENENQPDAAAFRGLHLLEIEQNADRLAAVVEDILRFAEANRGALAPATITAVEPQALVADVIAEVRRAADEKLVTLQVVVNAEPLQSDYAALRRILVQLIANGINFNYSGGTVRAEVTSASATVAAIPPGGLLIEVSDTGIGVPQDELDSIFEPFYRVNDPMVKQSDGLGLGLSMVKKAVERLDGTIEVYSSRHPRTRGTRFTVRIPPAAQSLQNQLADLRLDVKMQQEQAMMYAKGLQELYRELKDKNDELRAINYELEHANSIKSDFLGVIGHELRSPFVGLDGAIQNFKRAGITTLSTEQHAQFASIEQSAKSAFAMVDRLVKYTQFISKQGRLNLVYVHIAPLLDGVIESLRPLAGRRKVQVSGTYPTPLALPRGDVTLIGEAVFHLVQNAIKFTGAGGTVNINAYQDENILVVEVIDTGIGVPPEKQGVIWDSFAQMADPLTRGVEGLGLGLALVKYMATAHEGDVFLHSEAGRGSVFGFWLPLNG